MAHYTHRWITFDPQKGPQLGEGESPVSATVIPISYCPAHDGQLVTEVGCFVSKYHAHETEKEELRRVLKEVLEENEHLCDCEREMCDEGQITRTCKICKALR